jgi:hypothetical protein
VAAIISIVYNNNFLYVVDDRNNLYTYNFSKWVAVAESATPLQSIEKVFAIAVIDVDLHTPYHWQKWWLIGSLLVFFGGILSIAIIVIIVR